VAYLLLGGIVVATSIGDCALRNWALHLLKRLLN
jgi:hypothetical protein